MNKATRKRILISVFAAVLIVAAIFGFYIGTKLRKDKLKYQGGAVSANGKECAEIGSSIMMKGGSVADGAIATMICEGITCPQSTGLGGGFFMTIYIKETGVVETLDAREVAPLKSDENMFVNNSAAALEGGLSIAVPGEVKGMWELHKKYGKLPWSELFEPNIELCRNGHEVTPYLSRILDAQKKLILTIPSIREVFVNPETNDTWKAGDKIKRLKLADTLEIIAKEGADTIYNIGTIGKQMLEDIRGFGGILTEDDLRNYTVEWGSPVETTLRDGEKFYSMPLPGAGPVIALIMELLKNYELKKDVLSYHRIIEAYKFAYAYRSDFGDPRFVPGIDDLMKNLTDPAFLDSLRKRIDDNETHDISYYGGNFSSVEDHGTAHMAVLAPNGDAISVTGTINYILGSLRRSQQTGIILNDEMDDFSIPGQVNIYGIPASPANFIKPRKRPMSSMAPTLIIDKNGDVKMNIGSAGGSRIITAVASAILHHLYLDPEEGLTSIFNERRLHHQLVPNVLQYEVGFDSKILEGLIEKKHNVSAVNQTIGFGALVGIVRRSDNTLDAAVDPRRGGNFVIF